MSSGKPIVKSRSKPNANFDKLPAQRSSCWVPRSRWCFLLCHWPKHLMCALPAVSSSFVCSQSRMSLSIRVAFETWVQSGASRAQSLSHRPATRRGLYARAGLGGCQLEKSRRLLCTVRCFTGHPRWLCEREAAPPSALRLLCAIAADDGGSVAGGFPIAAHSTGAVRKSVTCTQSQKHR